MALAALALVVFGAYDSYPCQFIFTFIKESFLLLLYLSHIVTMPVRLDAITVFVITLFSARNDSAAGISQPVIIVYVYPTSVKRSRRPFRLMSIYLEAAVILIRCLITALAVACFSYTLRDFLLREPTLHAA